MIQIPGNGFADAGFKGEGRVVSKVCGYFVRVYGVAAVVAGPVGDMGDECFAGSSLGGWCLGESFCRGGICFEQVVKDCAEDQVDDVQVDLFVVAADVVPYIVITRSEYWPSTRSAVKNEADSVIACAISIRSNGSR